MLHRLSKLTTTMAPLKKKVIVIAGTTGVGKSKLAVELALRYNGEIINSDSMQVYQHLPIITNKHPLPERHGVTHHLIDYVPWTDQTYHLHRFSNDCLAAIEDILSRGKLPIIVGGTHYYLQILFDKQIESTKEGVLTSEQLHILNSDDSNLIYKKLAETDPEIAKRYHPNDIRRIKRMLEIYYKTNVLPSKQFESQTINLRYDTLFLWLYSEPDELHQRLDTRVDNMIEQGAIDEIKELYDFYCSQTVKPLLDSGVWQVIGFKEFLPWLQKKSSLADGIEKMKTRTRQYAKRQIKWITKKLVPDLNGDIYILNATNLNLWNSTVLERSRQIVDSFMKGNSMTDIVRKPKEINSIELNIPEEKPVQDYTNYSCMDCKDSNDNPLVAIGIKNWNIHLKSRRHRTNLKKKQKKLDYENWKVNKATST